MRQAREQGLTATLISDSALPTPEFWAIAGASGEGFTLQAYATIQLYAQAAEAAKSIKLPDLIKALQSTMVWQWHDGKYAEL
ncbi:MAG: branched chain amino acid transporter substrate-binding protein [Rhodospirillales bacterium]|nr:branched chain amino acid transporter substrate-binding protein [Rhodospirillales bacterium]